jgi:hypothetical protein
MKTTKTIILFGLAICVGFLIAQLCRAESTNKISNKETAYKEDVAMQELFSLYHYLKDTKQTNALKQLNDFLLYNDMQQRNFDLGLTGGILQKIREGNTDEALHFLENHLDMSISLFGSGYNALPSRLRADVSLKPLKGAYDYRKKFPSKNSDSDLSGVGLTNAFKILNQTN